MIVAFCISSMTVLRSEIPSGICAKLRTVAASNNRVYMPWSLYYCLFAQHICMVLFFTHIPFVVNHTINATPPERLQQQHKGSLNQSRRHEGCSGLIPSKFKYETLLSVVILSHFQNVKSICANVKRAYWRFFGHRSSLNLRFFRTTVSLRSILSSLKQQQTRESWIYSCNHLGRITWRVLLVCARFLWPWQASRNVVLKLCFNVFIPPLKYAVCLIFLSTDKKKQIWRL